MWKVFTFCCGRGESPWWGIVSVCVCVYSHSRTVLICLVLESLLSSLKVVRKRRVFTETSRMRRIVEWSEVINSCFVCVLSLSFLQTPEKKPNDQRTRKRKGDPFDSQGKLLLKYLTVTLSLSHLLGLSRAFYLQVLGRIYVVVRIRIALLNGISWLRNQ